MFRRSCFWEKKPPKSWKKNRNAKRPRGDGLSKNGADNRKTSMTPAKVKKTNGRIFLIHIYIYSFFLSLFFSHSTCRICWQRFRQTVYCFTRTPTVPLHRDGNNKQHYLTFRLFLLCAFQNEIRYDQTGDQRILRKDHQIRRSKVRFWIHCEKERFRG